MKRSKRSSARRLERRGSLRVTGSGESGASAGGKSSQGRFFEDFRLGETLVHATPRSLGEGERALYTALTGSRFALQSSDAFAQALGLPGAPLDDLLVFHVVFGKTVPDVSLNAVANLGYADGRFGVPVYPGDSLTAHSQVIGLRETSNREAGVVYLRSEGRNQRDESVLEYLRWVMVRKRDPKAAAPEAKLPELPEAVAPDRLSIWPSFAPEAYDRRLGGAPHGFDDYRPGERIDHVDGMTLEEAEHQLATRLYQNTARVHFNLFEQEKARFGRRLVYGGHVISIARALSFNGLANAFRIVALNGGRHAAPVFAGDTLFAWSEVLEKHALDGQAGLGMLRLRTIATKNRPCSDFPGAGAAPGKTKDPSVVLELDYSVLMPR